MWKFELGNCVGGGGTFCSGAAAGWGRCGGVVRPKEGVWEAAFGSILGGNIVIGSCKRREDAGIRSQIVSGDGRDACVTLARVSALSELRKPPKFTEN